MKNKMGMIEKRIYKLVEPVLAVSYALHKVRSHDEISPESYAEMIHAHFMNRDDIPEDMKKHMQDFSEYLRKGKD